MGIDTNLSIEGVISLAHDLLVERVQKAVGKVSSLTYELRIAEDNHERMREELRAFETTNNLRKRM